MGEGEGEIGLLANRKPNNSHSSELEVLGIYGYTEIKKYVRNSVGDGGRETSADTIKKGRGAAWGQEW